MFELKFKEMKRKDLFIILQGILEQIKCDTKEKNGIFQIFIRTDNFKIFINMQYLSNNSHR